MIFTRTVCSIININYNTSRGRGCNVNTQIYPKHLPYINYRMLRKRVGISWGNNYKVDRTAITMRVVYIICVRGKGVICFSKLLLCAPTISDPASHRPLGTPKIRKCMCLGVAGSEVSPPINKTLSKGFRRKEIILQMVTFVHHPYDNLQLPCFRY